MTDQENDRARRNRIRDPLQLSFVNVDRCVVVTADRSPIQRVDHFERERRLRCRHFPQVSLSLGENVLYGAIALLRDVGHQVAKVRVCKHIARQDAGHLVTRTAEDALRAFQCDQRLVGGKLRKRIVADSSLGLPPA